MSTTQIVEKETIDCVEMPIESIKKISKNKILVAHRNKAVFEYELTENPTSGPSLCLKSFKHRAGVSDVCFAEAGNKVLTCSKQTMNVFDRDSKEHSLFKGHNMDITSIAVNKDNTNIVTGSHDGTFIIWNTNGEQKERLGMGESGHKGWINKVEFVPETSETLATASEDGSVKIWDLETNNLLKTFIDGHFVDLKKLQENKQKVKANTDLAVKALCFSKDGSLMAYGGRNGKVYIINLSTNESLQIFDVPDRITAVAFGENHPYIAVATPNKVWVWNIVAQSFETDYENKSKHEMYCYSMTFMGDELVSGWSNGKIKRLEMIRK